MVERLKSKSGKLWMNSELDRSACRLDSNGANDTQIQDTLIACSQPIYISTFDVATITNSLSGPDFASGYAFSTSNVITNAFVDI